VKNNFVERYLDFQKYQIICHEKILKKVEMGVVDSEAVKANPALQSPRDDRHDHLGLPNVAFLTTDSI
jgi:hypothetical protein